MDQKHSKMFWRQWEKMPILGRCSPHRLDDNAATALQPESVSVILDQIEIQKAREAGSVYVGYQMWRRLQLDAIPRFVALRPRSGLRIPNPPADESDKPCSGQLAGRAGRGDAGRVRCGSGSSRGLLL